MCQESHSLHIGGPPVAMLFISTPQSHFVRQLPVKGSLLARYKLCVQCRTPSRSDRFNGVTGGAGGPKGRNRNLPRPPCKKIIKKLIFYLFVSLPQKIRLQRISSSPATQCHSGWNKVVLLTAVRNSPCSCPFSVSLHSPQAALNSEPHPKFKKRSFFRPAGFVAMGRKLLYNACIGAAVCIRAEERLYA